MNRRFTIGVAAILGIVVVAVGLLVFGGAWIGVLIGFVASLVLLVLIATFSARGYGQEPGPVRVLAR
jgi:hypothetical protein